MSEAVAEKVAGIVQRAADRLSRIPGVAAVVLGGSWSRGDRDSISDVDLGVYYRASDPPSVEALRQAAAELDTASSSPVATNFGDWGEWVNGGA
jgi:predicted nucleotidyltransferase